MVDRVEVGALGHVKLLGVDFDLGVLHHSAQEEDHGQQQADLDGDCKVENHRQQEGDNQHRQVALGGLEQPDNRAPAAHVVCHHHQHGGQAGHRHQADERHKEDEYRQQHQGVDDSRHRCAAAVGDVGHRAGDGPGDGYSADEGDGDVGQSLADQLGVGVGARAGHTVGHCGREQRLDCPEHGDGEGRGEEHVDGLHVKRECLQAGQLGLEFAEASPDCGHIAADAVEAKEVDGGGDQDYGHERARQAFRHLGGEDDDGEGDKADGQRQPVNIAQVGQVDAPFGDELRGDVLQPQPEEVVDLGGEDGQGDTGGEADDDGVWDELDDRAEPEKPHQHQYQSGHQCGQGETFKPEAGDDAVDDHDERAGGAADLHGVATEGRHHEAAEDGGHKADRGAHAAGDGKRDGEREGHDAHHHSGGEVGLELGGIVMFER